MSGNAELIDKAARAYWETIRELATIPIAPWDEMRGKSRRNVREGIKAALIAAGLGSVHSVELRINVVDNATPKLEEIKDHINQLIQDGTPNITDWQRMRTMEAHIYMPDGAGWCRYTNADLERCPGNSAMHEEGTWKG